jgi:hypothetical protein
MKDEIRPELFPVQVVLGQLSFGMLPFAGCRGIHEPLWLIGASSYCD